jgi:hypothetical protein
MYGPHQTVDPYHPYFHACLRPDMTLSSSSCDFQQAFEEIGHVEQMDCGDEVLGCMVQVDGIGCAVCRAAECRITIGDIHVPALVHIQSICLFHIGSSV